MERHFHRDIEQLHNRLFRMGELVQAAILKACTALFQQKRDLADEVLKADKWINELQIEVDEKGHGLIAMGQPMAIDLRHIAMILKINTDLERMGDHAVNIAVKCYYTVNEPLSEIKIPLKEMAEAVQKMLKDALDSFFKEDVHLAQNVLKCDDEIDSLNVKNYRLLKEVMEKKSTLVGAGMNLMMASHNLERIGDLANNIAENVIYWKQGREVRHRSENGD